jgi:hypothetical protein
MCTRANRASVPDSLHALVGCLVGAGRALLLLLVALATAPGRWARSRPSKHGAPASTRHVEVPVHLGDGERVGAIERSCRAALKRAARTWAPFSLPLDRVEVLSYAPPLGKVDIYEHWASVAPGASPMAGSLVVVSIGTTTGTRDLTPDEIAGALAGQIERLVIDRYQREHPPAEPTPVARESARQPVVARPAPTALELPRDDTPQRDNVTELSSVRALLADIKKSQPLVPAGPSENGVHRETDPA